MVRELHRLRAAAPGRPRGAPTTRARPILDQRGYWFANGAYDKPALATGPMGWVAGLPPRADGRLNYDPDLRLIHLHRMDYEHLPRRRHRCVPARRWDERT